MLSSVTLMAGAPWVMSTSAWSAASDSKGIQTHRADGAAIGVARALGQARPLNAR